MNSKQSLAPDALERLQTILESVSTARSPLLDSRRAQRRQEPPAAAIGGEATPSTVHSDAALRATLDVATLLQRSLTTRETESQSTAGKALATATAATRIAHAVPTVDADKVIEQAFEQLQKHNNGQQRASDNDKRVRFVLPQHVDSDSEADEAESNAVDAMMLDEQEMSDEQRREAERRREARRAARKRRRQDEQAKPPLREINCLQFGLLSPEEMRRLSVVEITKQRFFDHNAPVEGGLYDLRMGTTMRQFKCESCDLRFKDCPGHFGRIELATPVYHPLFLDTLIKVLNCVCLDCSALLVPKTRRFVQRQERSKRAQDRLRHVYDSIKSKTTNKQCCGTPSNERYRVSLDQLRTGIDSTAPQSSASERRSGAMRAGMPHTAPVDNALEQGCGHFQPKVVRDGLKVVLNYPPLPATVVKARKAALAAETADTDSAATRADDDARDTVDSGDGAAATGTTTADKKKRKKTVAPEKEYDRVRRERAGQSIDMMPEEALAILQRISEEDCWLLGFNPQFGHPAWMIMQVLPVAPPVVRPAVMTPHGKKPITHDHMTVGYLEIVKKNNALAKQLEHDISAYQRQYKLLLQYHVATLIVNDGKGIPKAMIGESKQRAALVERFKGKKGRLRGNLMGKRVDFASRTVIGPDPNLALNEVGVPPSVAQTLTYPERVNRFNIERLQRSVTLGPSALSGAKFVIDREGRCLDLQYKRDVALKIGYTVERHLRDGDLVAFNRQPSLHKESIMAHRVRIVPRSTFGMNLSATGPYNADFDGDEMQIHVPQSEPAKAELQVLMDVGQCLISPQNNKPAMGLVQDSLLTARLLTMRDTFLERHQAMQMLMYATISFGNDAQRGLALPVPCIVRPRALWSGKQLLSLLLPADFQHGPSANNSRPDGEPADAILSPSDSRVLIRDGQLLCGTLDKKFLGAVHGSIVHVLANDYGPQVARVFLEEAQGIMQHYMTGVRSFSVGIADCTIAPETKRKVRQVVRRTQRDVDALVDDYYQNRIEPLPLMSIDETFEAKMNRVLNGARDEAGRVVSRSLDGNVNNLKLMVSAGSKGGEVNIAQIAGIVGQQNLNGQRIPTVFKGGRAMPHGRKHDLADIASRGFVARSYMDGLTPTEMFTHSIGGREGLVDTAVKSVTGNTQITIYERDGRQQTVCIGAWIDALLAEAEESGAVQHHAARNLELLDISGKCILIPTVDFAGNYSRSPLTAVTRHDPGDVLYRLKTLSGREVIATDSKSVLCFDDEAQCLTEVEPQNLVIGKALLPVMLDANENALPETVRFNHIVLEPLIALEKIDAKQYPKVYDVTVPATLNFGLANGLMVRDTATIGYIQRRLIKAGEDVSVAQDRTVRNSVGAIVQFLYGDDNLDGAAFEWQPVEILQLPDNAAMRRRYAGDPQRYTAAECSMLDVECEQLIAMRDTIRRAVAPRDDTRWPLAGNLRRRIAKALHAQQKDKVAAGLPVDVTDAKRMLDRWQERLYESIDPAGVKRDRAERAVFFYVAHVRGSLSPRYAREHHRVTRETLQRLLDELAHQYGRLQVAAGEGVGPLAAQAIGEPATQMTLNTFHFAGISAKNVTLGVPRLEELIKASPNIKTPSITLYLRYDVHGDDAAHVETQARQARLLAGKVRTVRFKDVLFGRAQVLHEPYGVPLGASFSERERRSVQRAEAHRLPRAVQARNAQYGPPLDWVVRLPLSRKKLFEYGLTPSLIAHTLLRHYEGAIDVICSDNNEISMLDEDDSCRDGAPPLNNNKRDGEGGFVRLRMHTYMALDALRSVLPDDRHDVLDALERETMNEAQRRAAAQDRCVLPIVGVERRLCAASARAREIVRKRRARRKSSSAVSSAVVDDAPQTPRRHTATLSHSDLATTTTTPLRMPSSVRGENRDGNVATTMSSGVQTAPSSPPFSRTPQRADSPYRAAAAASSGGSEDQCNDEPLGASLVDADNDEQSEREEEETLDEIWGRLDASVCIPMLLERLAHDVRDLLLDGVDTVSNVTVREEARLVYDRESGARNANAREWLLETDGRNLEATFALRGIDHTRTRCNNPVEVARVLGIEAARHCLLLEFRHVLQFDGAYVNYRHIALYCDIMTQSGSLMAINRHGLNKRQTGPFMRATLEESVSMLVNAGCFSEFDPARGPSERVAIGQPLSSGTGTHIATLLDHEALARLIDQNGRPRSDEKDDDEDTNGHSRSTAAAASSKRVIDSTTTPFAPMWDANDKHMLLDIESYRRKAAESSVAAQRQRSSRGFVGLSSTGAVATTVGTLAALRNPFETQSGAPLVDAAEAADRTLSADGVTDTAANNRKRKAATSDDGFAAPSAPIGALNNPFDASRSRNNKRRRTQTDTARVGDTVFRNPFASRDTATDSGTAPAAVDDRLADLDARQMYALDTFDLSVDNETALRQPFYVPSSPSRFPNENRLQ